MTITHYIDPIGIQFIDFSRNYSLKYDIPHVNISPEYVKSKDFILGLNFILGLQVGPLYSKTTKNGQRNFNKEDIKLIKEIKEVVKKIKPLELPLVSLL